MANTTQPISGKELNILVMHPERIIFDGKARAITGKNERGTFDVLPRHSNFVSIIKEKVTILDLDGKKRDIPIEEAIMKVQQNQVWVFVGIKEKAISNITPPPIPQGEGVGRT